MERSNLKTDEELKKRAWRLLEENRRTAVWQGKTYTFTIPSPTHYPFQWFWDSCFHVISLTKLEEIDRAKGEIESLLVWQKPSGEINHIVYYWDQAKMKLAPGAWNWLDTKPFLSFIPFSPKPKTSALIQPPVLAQAVERIFQKSHDRQWLKEIFPKIAHYYRWLTVTRDPDRDGLISIIAPYESGLDQSPAYDRAAPNGRGILFLDKLFCYRMPLIDRWGQFLVEDVLMNSILGKNLRVLAQLAQELKKPEEAREFGKQANRVTQALLAKCWDEEGGMFWNLDGREERSAKIKTIISLMPLILEDLPKDIAHRLVQEHLTNPQEFWTNYPITSVAANEETFTVDDNPKVDSGLWRGPTWVATNWFLSKGLEQHGFAKEARFLADKTKELVLRGGFREYYDPFTGEPGQHSALNFGWSTLVVDL